MYAAHQCMPSPRVTFLAPHVPIRRCQMPFIYDAMSFMMAEYIDDDVYYSDASLLENRGGVWWAYRILMPGEKLRYLHTTLIKTISRATYTGGQDILPRHTAFHSDAWCPAASAAVTHLIIAGRRAHWEGNFGLDIMAFCYICFSARARYTLDEAFSCWVRLFLVTTGACYWFEYTDDWRDDNYFSLQCSGHATQPSKYAAVIGMAATLRWGRLFIRALSALRIIKCRPYTLLPLGAISTLMNLVTAEVSHFTMSRADAIWRGVWYYGWFTRAYRCQVYRPQLALYRRTIAHASDTLITIPQQMQRHVPSYHSIAKNNTLGKFYRFRRGCSCFAGHLRRTVIITRWFCTSIHFRSSCQCWGPKWHQIEFSFSHAPPELLQCYDTTKFTPGLLAHMSLSVDNFRYARLNWYQPLICAISAFISR